MAEAYALVIPPLVFVSALLLTKTWEADIRKRLVWALALIFSFDLLSGSSQVVYGVFPLAYHLANMVGEPGLLKPDLMDFFILYRRPDPSASWLIFFPYLAGAIASFITWRPTLYRILCLVTPILAIVYINVAIIALILFTLLSLASALVYRRPVLIDFVLALSVTLIAFTIVFAGASTKAAANLAVFQTHLPVLRLSLFFGAIGLTASGFQAWKRRGTNPPNLWAAAVAFSVPIITLEQQIVTGRAVLPQNWELSGNYICIVLGCAMLLSRADGGEAKRESRIARVGLSAIWLGLLALIVRGHLLTESYFTFQNNDSVAYAKVYQEALAKVVRIDRVVLPHVFEDSLFVTRVPQDVVVLGGYNWLLTNPSPVWDIRDDFIRHSAKSRAYFAQGFETLARRGVTVDAFREGLASQIRTGDYWPTLMYFFSLYDCWPTLSNYTSPGLALLPSAVTVLDEMYENFLHEGAVSVASGTVLLIAKEPLAADDGKMRFRHTLVAAIETTVRGLPIRAYGYLQSLR
jgi:hypothetical protein